MPAANLRSTADRWQGPGRLLPCIVVRLKKAVDGLNRFAFVRPRDFDLQGGAKTGAENQDADDAATVSDFFPEPAEDTRPESSRKRHKATRPAERNAFLPRHNDNRLLHVD